MKTIIFTMMTLLIILNSACYTKFSNSKKITPQHWQQTHTREINHRESCPECYKWSYYYDYPAWMQIGDNPMTGYKRFLRTGEKTLEGLYYVGRLSFEVFISIPRSRSRRCTKVTNKKIPPEERSSRNDDKNDNNGGQISEENHSEEAGND